MMGCRLMAGRRALNAAVVVRIHASQHYRYEWPAFVAPEVERLRGKEKAVSSNLTEGSEWT